ncbi:MAG: polysaccharide biosynthesis tyrosine autokinase [Endomicrobiia bacterium]|nr:polysaccharide biosynthesis tyrosine autokinase [Endomicrobiia bacterium]
MNQYTLGIHDYWRIIRRKKWVIIFAAAATVFSTYIYTDMQTPLYRATAEVKVEQPKSIPGVAVDQSGWDMYMALNTEVKVIKSAVVAQRTARKLGMLDDKMSESARQSVILSLQNMVDAERVGDSNLIRISASASDARQTALVANATADTYIEKGIDDRSRRARELKEFIERQMEESHARLKEAEDSLRKFTESSGAKGTGGFLASRLVDIETRKSELLKKFTEQHPEVKQLSDQINAVESQMKHLPKEELEYARLIREVKINEELYTLLAKRYKEAEISEADREQTAAIVTPAVEPARPVRPNKTMNVAVGVFIGVFFGFVLAIFFENLDTSIGTIEDVEHFLGVPVIGIIPHEAPTRLKTSKKDDRISAQRSLMIIFHSSKSPFVESYHTMRTNLQFTAFREKGNVINFTSAGVSEGKTIMTINFALAAAQSGTKTVLVEMDLRRPLLHKILGLPRAPGITEGVLGRPLSEVVRGTADLMLGELSVERIIDVPGIENLKVVTCGEIPTNPIDFLNSSSTRSFIKALSQSFELVILDCPPVLLFADPLIISSIADATILVYQVGKMSRSALKRAKDQLAGVKANIVGVALNDIKASDMQHRYGYYYTYKYYNKG